ncbi:MAG: hypothetical protein WED07_02860 [Candidatus Freyarchaeum deiterrae]
MSTSTRPVPITFFTIIALIMGVLGIVASMLIFFVYAVPSITNLSTDGDATIGVIVLIVAVVYLITSFGLWMLKNWARLLMLILVIPTIIGSFLALFVFPIGTVAGIIGFIFCIIIVVYMTGEVKVYFG